jgi:hypothetical protein
MEKIIHQIWVGPYNPPERDKQFADTIKEAHPNFEYQYWDNSILNELPSDLSDIVHRFAENQKWVNIADMLRYYVVNKYGGLYIDMDYQLKNPLDDLNLERYDGFIPMHFNVGETICNSMFGFKKNHPIINYVCQQVPIIPVHDDWVGPHFFGRNIKHFLGLQDSDIDVTVDRMLCTMNIKTMHSRGEFKQRYLHHHYSYTWHPLNQEKLTINKDFNL